MSSFSENMPYENRVVEILNDAFQLATVDWVGKPELLERLLATFKYLKSNLYRFWTRDLLYDLCYDDEAAIFLPPSIMLNFLHTVTAKLDVMLAVSSIDKGTTPPINSKDFYASVAKSLGDICHQATEDDIYPLAVLEQMQDPRIDRTKLLYLVPFYLLLTMGNPVLYLIEIKAGSNNA